MAHRNRHRIAASLCEAGHRLDTLGLVPARDGNISARVSDRTLLITRTGVRKRDLTPDHLVEVDLDGNTVAPRDGTASTELGLHLVCYRLRPDVESVMHAHPPTAVGFACSGLGLTDCLMPEVAVNLGAVPLTPYATPGTPALEESVSPAIRDHDAFLLANHGAVTMGTSVDQALDRMETLEHFAKILFTARLMGGPHSLPPHALADLEDIRRRMGNPRPVTCAPAPSGGPNPGSAPSLDAGPPSGASPSPQTPSDPEIARIVAEVVRTVLDSPNDPR